MIRRLFGVVLAIVTTALQHTLISHRSRQKLAAENLFLRKQLALFKGVPRTFARKVNGAVAKMRVGPSEPPFRRRLQTAHCCCVQKAWW
jgi:hypothetical protein